MKDDLSPRGGSRSRMRSALVVAQVAVSVLLLVGAGLVVRSLEAARTANVGFDERHVTAVTVELQSSGYDEARGRVFYERLLDALRAQSGNDTASLASILPLTMVDSNSLEIAVEGHEPRKGEDMRLLVNSVSPGYLETLRIPLLAGRDFARTDREASLPVAIVNETMARRYWAHAGPGPRQPDPCRPQTMAEHRRGRTRHQVRTSHGGTAPACLPSGDAELLVRDGGPCAIAGCRACAPGPDPGDGRDARSERPLRQNQHAPGSDALGPLDLLDGGRHAVGVRHDRDAAHRDRDLRADLVCRPSEHARDRNPYRPRGGSAGCARSIPWTRSQTRRGRRRVRACAVFADCADPGERALRRQPDRRRLVQHAPWRW